MMTMPATATVTVEAILHNRHQGHRDSTYAMLMQLVATNQMPECLHALEQMAWRDVSGFIRHFERNAFNHYHHASAALIQGCVRITNAQLRKDCCAATARGWSSSLTAKWVPREPKCRGSPTMMWYYDALAADMFPGAPDAKRRYRKLISWLSPPPQTSVPSLAWFVKQAERGLSEGGMSGPEAQEINAAWQRRLARRKPWKDLASGDLASGDLASGDLASGDLVPVLSLAHSMGPGHNNCLHAGIGLALHLSSSGRRIITFSSQAEVHVLEGDDFVSQAQHLLRAARSPLNGLNANLVSAATVISAASAAKSAATTAAQRIIIIGDMEHDVDDPSLLQTFACVTWNVSRNGRPATFCGEKMLRSI